MWGRIRAMKDASPLLVLALVSLILARSIDQTIFYRLAQVYTNYVWYLGAVILPIAFLFISWPVVWWKMVFTDDISPAMREFPHRRFLVMGALDTCFNLLSTWPIYWVGGTVANVLSQLVLPFNMVGSLLFLGTRYRKVHYIGSILAIYGVLVRLIPRFNGEARDEHPHHRHDGHAEGWAYLGWVLMLVAAQVPAAGSNVYKEIALKNANLDVWYMNAWIGVYQLLFGLITLPAIALPLTPHHLSLKAFPAYLKAANQCFFGNSVMPTDDCSGDGLPVVVFCFFIVFNVTCTILVVLLQARPLLTVTTCTDNQLMLYVFKRGSSVLFVIASAVRLPLVDLLLLSTFIAGRAYERFTIFDGFALFALVMAIVVYYSEKEERRVADSVDGVRSVTRTPKMGTPKYNTQRLLRGSSSSRKAKWRRRQSHGSRAGARARDESQRQPPPGGPLGETVQDSLVTVGTHDPSRSPLRGLADGRGDGMRRGGSYGSLERRPTPAVEASDRRRLLHDPHVDDDDDGMIL